MNLNKYIILNFEWSGLFWEQAHKASGTGIGPKRTRTFKIFGSGTSICELKSLFVQNHGPKHEITWSLKYLEPEQKKTKTGS